MTTQNPDAVPTQPGFYLTARGYLACLYAPATEDADAWEIAGAGLRWTPERMTSFGPFTALLSLTSQRIDLLLDALDELAGVLHDTGDIERLQTLNHLRNDIEAHA